MHFYKILFLPSPDSLLEASSPEWMCWLKAIYSWVGLTQKKGSGGGKTCLCPKGGKIIAKIQEGRKMSQLPSINNIQTPSSFLYVLIQQSLKFSEKQYYPYFIVTEKFRPCPRSIDPWQRLSSNLPLVSLSLKFLLFLV